MARLTYVFGEDTPPSPKDTELSEKAYEKGIKVEVVPDEYPGIAGEFQLHGDASVLRDVLDSLSEDSPGHPTEIQYSPEETDEVEAHFDREELQFSELN